MTENLEVASWKTSRKRWCLLSGILVLTTGLYTVKLWLCTQLWLYTVKLWLLSWKHSEFSQGDKHAWNKEQNNLWLHVWYKCIEIFGTEIYFPISVLHKTFKKQLGLGKSNLAICSGRDLFLEVSTEQTTITHLVRLTACLSILWLLICGVINQKLLCH